MTFREQVAVDVTATFLNALEFAEVHSIDGKDVLCVFDTDADGELAADAGSGIGMAEGVYVTRKRIFCREDDLAKAPRQGKHIDVDGEPYLTLSVAREMGMVVLTVAENAA
jgi:hypothetical protein